MDVSPLSPNASQSDYLAGRLPACTVAASSLFDTIATAAISYIIQVLSPTWSAPMGGVRDETLPTLPDALLRHMCRIHKHT